MFRRICAVFLIIFLTAGFIGLVWGEKNLSLGETDTYGEFRYQMMATGEGIEITGYTGTSSVVEIPADIEGEPVVSIGLRAFKEKSLTEVMIENFLK